MEENERDRKKKITINTSLHTPQNKLATKWFFSHLILYQWNFAWKLK